MKCTDGVFKFNIKCASHMFYIFAQNVKPNGQKCDVKKCCKTQNVIK